VSARVLRLSTGYGVTSDGDLLALIEAFYREVTLKNALNASFETMREEILGAIDQMTEVERREYLFESLFLNTVNYENEKLAAYVRELAANQGSAPSRKRSVARQAAAGSAPQTRKPKPATPKTAKTAKTAKRRSRVRRATR
jgi:hypothetical protein